MDFLHFRFYQILSPYRTKLNVINNILPFNKNKPKNNNNSISFNTKEILRLIDRSGTSFKFFFIFSLAWISFERGKKITNSLCVYILCVYFFFFIFPFAPRNALEHAMAPNKLLKCTAHRFFTRMISKR